MTCDALFDALLEEVLECKAEAGGRTSKAEEAESQQEIEHWDLFRALHDDMSAEQVDEAEANAKWEVANKNTRHEDSGGTWHREAGNRHALRKKKGPLRTSQNTVGGASFQDGLGSVGRERSENDGDYVDPTESTLGLATVAGITLDSSISIEEQIARALQNRMTRVMDLFKVRQPRGQAREALGGTLLRTACHYRPHVFHTCHLPSGVGREWRRPDFAQGISTGDVVDRCARVQGGAQLRLFGVGPGRQREHRVRRDELDHQTGDPRSKGAGCSGGGVREHGR